MRARIAQLELAAVEERRTSAEERREAATLARNRTAKELEALLGERDRVEGELVGAAGGREEATAARYRLKSAAERLEHRRESAQALAGRLRADPPRVRSAERERLLEEARLGRDRLGALERALAELEGLPPAARALRERGETLVLSSLDVDQGDSGPSPLRSAGAPPRWSRTTRRRRSTFSSRRARPGSGTSAW